MSLKNCYLFILTSLFLLFYPGNNPFFDIISHNEKAFERMKDIPEQKIYDIPINTSYIPDLSALGVYVVDLDSFSPVYAKNQHLQLYPASTVKIISSLVAVDIFDPEKILTIGQSTIEGQIMDLIPGEKISVENVLYGMLVHSGNDAAYALANEKGFGTFIKLMNEKALSLGMYDSKFSNPAGLDEPGQLTSPFDLAVAARELLKNPSLRHIVGTKEIVVSDVDYKIFHKLTNVNKLLGEVQGLGGLKTGYTEEAGENLVSFYIKNGHRYLIVVMKSEDRFADTLSIITWLNNHIRFQPVII